MGNAKVVRVIFLMDYNIIMEATIKIYWRGSACSCCKATKSFFFLKKKLFNETIIIELSDYYMLM